MNRARSWPVAPLRTSNAVRNHLYYRPEGTTVDTDEFAADTRDVTPEVHWMLLRMAGSLPDDLVTECRHWLAEGRRAEIARALTHAVLSQRRPVGAADVALLGELLVEAGADA